MKCLWKTGVAAVLLAAALLSGQGASAAANVVRVFDDASTGTRWLLERDAMHPGGPGRLIRVEARAGLVKGGQVAIRQVTVVRAGERVIAEERTAVLEARLEAVALGPAAAGGALQVRLTIGGRVLAAVAVDAGHVRLVEEAR